MQPYQKIKEEVWESIYIDMKTELEEWFGLKIGVKSFNKILGSSPNFVGEVVAWGTGDTETRSSAVDTISRYLTGRSWPMSLDGWSEVELEAFNKELNKKLEEIEEETEKEYW